MRVLVISPHNDDEVLGVGGTIAKLSKAGHEVVVCVAANGNGEDGPINEKCGRKAHKILGVRESVFLDLPAMGLKDIGVIELNGYFERLTARIKPELAFIPFKGDMHADHFMTAESALVALRPQYNPQLRAILAYETLSETEWNIQTPDNVFVPSVWCDITDTVCTKLEAFRMYTLQKKIFPHPRSEEAVLALARLRGSSVCLEYAESFMLVRGILQVF